MRPLDSYGNPPSDEAWEGHRKRLIELNIKYGPALRKELEDKKEEKPA